VESLASMADFDGPILEETLNSIESEALENLKLKLEAGARGEKGTVLKKTNGERIIKEDKEDLGEYQKELSNRTFAPWVIAYLFYRFSLVGNQSEGFVYLVFRSIANFVWTNSLNHNIPKIQINQSGILFNINPCHYTNNWRPLYIC
jgi:hypothetical protein